MEGSGQLSGKFGQDGQRLGSDWILGQRYRRVECLPLEARVLLMQVGSMGGEGAGWGRRVLVGVCLQCLRELGVAGAFGGSIRCSKEHGLL